MNQYVDLLISSYFDENNVPWTNTIDTYMKYCVDQGNVDQIVKNKLTDVCYYIIDIVIPNIPSTANPNPIVAWPAIQWLSTSSLPVVMEPSYQVLDYSNTWNTNYFTASSLGASNKQKFNDDFGSATGPSAGGSGSNNNGGGNGNNNCPSNSCNIQCPTSCFAAMISGSNGNGNSSGGGNSNNGNSSEYIFANDYSFSEKMNLNTFNTLSHTNNVYIGNNLVQTYEITDKLQTSSATTLNNMLKNNILEYFFIQNGSNVGRPTSQGISAFNQLWGSNPSIMDEFHKDKLKDLVYYVMEMIIPGLPTSKTPRSYVEWKPIKWLTH